MPRVTPIAVVLFAGVTATAAPKATPAKRVGRPHGAHADNMPRGFTWPPDRTMEAAAKACEDRLDSLGVAWHPAPREGRMVDAVTLGNPQQGGDPQQAGDPQQRGDAANGAQVGGIAYVPVYAKTLPAMDCQLALALANLAPRLYDAGVREVHVGSTYRFTKVRVGGKTLNMLSRHALGLAMDVVSFVDDTGREAVVARDYKRGDELLLSVERTVNDSGIFRTVLTPKNDPKSHHDHFHLEANPDYSDATDAKPSS